MTEEQKQRKVDHWYVREKQYRTWGFRLWKAGFYMLYVNTAASRTCTFVLEVFEHELSAAFRLPLVKESAHDLVRD